MSAVNSWLYSVFAVSVCTGVAEVFAPAGNTKKYVRYIISLVTLIVIIAPLTKALEGIPSLLGRLSDLAYGSASAPDMSDIDGEGVYAALIETGRLELEKKLRGEICAKFGISEGDICAELSVDASEYENITVTEVKIYLEKGKYPFVSLRDIASYASDLSGCTDVTAVYDDGSE